LELFRLDDRLFSVDQKNHLANMIQTYKKGEVKLMKTKYQTLVTAAVSAAIIIVVGVIAMGLMGLYLLTPAAAAKPEAAPAIAPDLQAQEGTARTITVVGEGKVSAQPDVAQINMGIEVVGPDIKEASSQAEAAMNGLLAALKGAGVAEKDIQTSYYNVWVERPYGQQGGPSGDTIYHVSNSVNVTVRDLDNVANILSQAIEAGANNINSINFSIADPTPLRSEARQQAVSNAEAKAAELAGLNGVEVSEVVRISEVVGGAVPFEFAAAAGVGGGGAGPISPGEVEVSAQLQITYAIK
jgi:uncharacterized protein YggE